MRDDPANKYAHLIAEYQEYINVSKYKEESKQMINNEQGSTVWSKIQSAAAMFKKEG